MSKLPKFKSDKQAADWFDTHDTAPLMDNLHKFHESLPVRRTRPTKKPVGLRLRTDYLKAIKQTAERKGIPYQSLIQIWLVDKLRKEAPDLIHESE